MARRHLAPGTPLAASTKELSTTCHIAWLAGTPSPLKAAKFGESQSVSKMTFGTANGKIESDTETLIHHSITPERVFSDNEILDLKAS